MQVTRLLSVNANYREQKEIITRKKKSHGSMALERKETRKTEF